MSRNVWEVLTAMIAKIPKEEELRTRLEEVNASMTYAAPETYGRFWIIIHNILFQCFEIYPIHDGWEKDVCDIFTNKIDK